MGEQKRFIRKKIRKTPYVLFYTYLLIVLLSLFSVASYTWFTLSKTPQVRNMNVHIVSGAGLELSADPGAEVWSNQLDIYSTKELADYKGEDKEKPPLYQTTWSDQEQCFYGPRYGFDGRLMPLTGFDHSLMEIVSWFPLDDQEDANTLTHNYYIKATLYARCAQPIEVTLAEPMMVNNQGIQGSGTYVIGDPNTGRGPETAIRVGMRMTYVDSSGNELSERGPMYIYEPNSDRHVDGSTDYIPTYGIHDLDQPLVEDDRLIIQKFSRRNEPGEFLTTPTLFSVKTGEIVRIELYIWLEGQDVDCSNVMSDGVTTTKIEANIQLTGTSESQSGMVPIE